MFFPARGRHRAYGRLFVARVTRSAAILAVSGGLVATLAAGANAAPTTPAPLNPSSPAALAPSTPATTLPTVVLPAQPVSSNVRWGSRGNAVRTVQGVVGADVDGVFGPRTHAAVKRWQSRHGLVSDGIVGPITRGAMGLSGGESSAARGGGSASRGGDRPANPGSGGVLGYAQQYTGIRYSWGGTSPSTGFDCSGYTQFVFDKVGINLPRTAEAQRRAATPVSQPKPGDLVFWGAPAWHTAIYAGDGMIYDSGRAGLPTQKRKMFSGVTSYGRVG